MQYISNVNIDLEKDKIISSYQEFGVIV